MAHELLLWSIVVQKLRFCFYFNHRFSKKIIHNEFCKNSIHGAKREFMAQPIHDGLPSIHFQNNAVTKNL